MEWKCSAWSRAAIAGAGKPDESLPGDNLLGTASTGSCRRLFAMPFAAQDKALRDGVRVSELGDDTCPPAPLATREKRVKEAGLRQARAKNLQEKTNYTAGVGIAYKLDEMPYAFCRAAPWRAPIHLETSSLQALPRQVRRSNFMSPKHCKARLACKLHM
ncbi:hypothetical protein OPU71_06670 [Niveibacterium sp. 24ML]|uniref:hypothetical protein n=1 Tax=Niveibacterium sp. 24ML TaxID=2985512 RepID=UPI00226DA15B|nr:hypothetical protein [Niveibacterium sp. 24ML]MCX9155809.1 hypothetical protein [Niveibacterium sp. 24ML]